MAQPFTWFALIPGVRDWPVHLTNAIFVAVLLIILSVVVYKNVRSSSQSYLPDEKISSRNIFEVIIEWLYNLMKEIIGHGAEKYVPLIGTIFIYILISNLLGLVPEFYPPTININTNLAIAAVVFFMYNYYGFKENGVGYLKHFIGPMWAIAVLYVPIEIISHLFRPVTLSVRLFGNIFGDHNVIEIFQELIPIGAPVIFMFLGIIVSVMQAFVFALLTVIYIALAVSHEH